MNILELKDVSFAYDSSFIINNFSHAFKEGEFTGIIGPNGAGKTTVLKIISGILKDYRGEVILSGKDIKKFSPKERARLMGFVPQETVFSLNYRVLEIVAMGRYPYLKPFQKFDAEDIGVIDEAIHFTQLDKLKDRPVLALSSGERQRVVIARALAQRPKILLLDEPTSHLDLHHQQAIMEILKRLNEKNITIIVVNHDLNLTCLYCPNIILMNEGRIYAYGSPREIINEETLKKIYKTDVEIITHPEGNVPQVFLKKG